MAKKQPPDRAQLIDAAKAAMKNAYAPYSKFRVGAAVLTSAGQIFTGCNGENASYGMTNCAARTTIFSAIASDRPKLDIRPVAVANDPGVACSPCRACRQAIYELGPEAIIF